METTPAASESSLPTRSHGTATPRREMVPEAVIRRVIIVHAPSSAPRTGPRRRRPARYARNAVLWGITAFLLVQLGLALAIELWLPQLRDPYYAHKVQRLNQRRQEAPTPPPTVIMLGSSRTVYALRGQMIEQHRAIHGKEDHLIVFNLGVPGAGPLTQLLVLRRLLEQGIRPDLLLIEVLPPVLAGHVLLPEIHRMVPERLWWDDLPVAERYLPPEDDLRAAWCRAWPLPAYNHRFAIMSEVAPAMLPFPLRLDWFQRIDDSGWVAPPWRERTPERYQHALARTRGEYSYYLEDFRLGGPNIPALRELLTLCRDEKIATQLVLMPEGTDFRSWYSPEAWRQIETFLAEVQEEFEVPLVNARTWSPDEDFSDSHHLMPDGAERFTERLDKEVIAPALSQLR